MADVMQNVAKTVEEHLANLQKKIDELVAEREKLKGDPSAFQQKKS